MRQCRLPPSWPSPATPCCSLPRPRAWTCSVTTPTGGIATRLPSAGSSNSCSDGHLTCGSAPPYLQEQRAPKAAPALGRCEPACADQPAPGVVLPGDRGGDRTADP